MLDPTSGNGTGTPRLLRPDQAGSPGRDLLVAMMRVVEVVERQPHGSRAKLGRALMSFGYDVLASEGFYVDPTGRQTGGRHA